MLKKSLEPQTPKKNSTEKAEFKTLPDDLIEEIAAQLPLKNLTLLTKSSRRMHGLFQPTVNKTLLLQSVAYGEQDGANALFGHDTAKKQLLLQAKGTFTDYSGRTFNCTAYEYAYWAKDTHMCRMLAGHMNEETKAYVLARIEINDKKGLAYQQNHVNYRSTHFDFNALKTALQAYVDGYYGWLGTDNVDAMQAAWLDVGKAQRDIPAHVAHEYCQADRTFYPRPSFNQAKLPRAFTLFNWTTDLQDSWFPLKAPDRGLGFDFVLLRSGGNICSVEDNLVADWSIAARCDLEAINYLDEVRTMELEGLRENLAPPPLHEGTMKGL